MIGSASVMAQLLLNVYEGVATDFFFRHDIVQKRPLADVKNLPRLRPAISLKKRLSQGYFIVNFAKS